MANQSDKSTGLDDLKNDMQQKVKNHDSYAATCASTNSFYNIAGIVLSSLAGISALTDLAKLIPYLTIITAILAILAVIANGINKIQDYATKAGQHQATKAAFEGCMNTATFLIEKKRDGKPVEDKENEALQEAIKKANSTEPVIPKSLFAKSRDIK